MDTGRWIPVGGYRWVDTGRWIPVGLKGRFEKEVKGVF